MPSSEPTWYYAQDDREHGPVTAAYIAGMAKTGKLRPDDLVWREGMEDWRPARLIKGLFSPVERRSGAASDTAVLEPPFDALPPSSPALHAPPRDESGPNSAGSDSEAATSAGAVSQPAPPPVAPENARVEDAVEFDAGAPSSAVEVDEFDAAAPPAELEGARLSAEVVQRSGRVLMVAGLLLALLSRGWDLAAERSVERVTAPATLAASVESDQSAGMTDAARRALASHREWAFWRAVCYLIGAILFAVGLIPLAFAGEGADRWLGIVLLAVLALAVFLQRAP